MFSQSSRLRVLSSGQNLKTAMSPKKSAKKFLSNTGLWGKVQRTHLWFHSPRIPPISELPGLGMIQIPGCYLKKIQGPFLEKTVKKLVAKAPSRNVTYRRLWFDKGRLQWRLGRIRRQKYYLKKMQGSFFQILVAEEISRNVLYRKLGSCRGWRQWCLDRTWTQQYRLKNGPRTWV